MAVLNTLLHTLLRGLQRLLGMRAAPSETPGRPGVPPTLTGLPTARLSAPVKAASAPPAPTVLPSPRLDESPCQATIHPELGAVNIRSGPGLTFTRIERAAGGATFGLAGVSAPDADGFPWYWLVWEDGSGWVRGDLATMAGDCEALLVVPVPAAPAAPPPAPPDADDLFPPPTSHRVVQGFHADHPGHDLAAPVGTPIHAPAAGLVVRRLDCLHCAPDQPNIHPATLTPAERQQVFSDPGWGFGYGNLIVVRFNYEALPAPLQEHMDGAGLTGGFAYVLYAHLSQIDVQMGDAVEAGANLGATGNTGHSSGPHLHLEVRVGRDEQIEGRWALQVPVPPYMMFRES